MFSITAFALTFPFTASGMLPGRVVCAFAEAKPIAAKATMSILLIAFLHNKMQNFELL
jgi:hypothetical protein